MSALTSVSATLALVALAVVLLGGLLLVPLGLPGLWVMLGAGLLYWLVIPAGGIGVWTVAGGMALVVAAEVLEFTIAARYIRQYGGSRRAAWGSIVGGLVGAVMGLPVPVIGSVLAAFAGAFVGAYVGERSVHRDVRNDPTRVATGAVVGRAIAAAAKSGLGVALAIWLFAVALMGWLRAS